jgi:hypothetical protein
MRWRLVRNSPRGSCGKELKYAFDFFSSSYGNKFKDKERFFGPYPRRVVGSRERFTVRLPGTGRLACYSVHVRVLVPYRRLEGYRMRCG